MAGAYTDESQIADIRLTTRVNGETRQDDRTGRLIFGFRYRLHYISTFTTRGARRRHRDGNPDRRRRAGSIRRVTSNPATSSRSRPTASACCATA